MKFLKYLLIGMLMFSASSYAETQLLPGYVKVKSITTTYTATNQDQTVIGNATSGTFTISLPDATTSTGKEYTFRKSDSSTNWVNITATGSHTIDGLTTQSLVAQNAYVTVYSDGTNWNIKNKSSSGEIVGSAYWEPITSCTWARSSAGFADYAAVSACNNPTITGSLLSAPATKVPHVLYNNTPPAKYEVSFFGGVTGGVYGSYGCYWQLVDDLGNVYNMTSNGAPSTSATIPFSLSGAFSYTSTGNRTWKIQGNKASGGAGSCDISAWTDSTGGVKNIFIVKRFPLAGYIY